MLNFKLQSNLGLIVQSKLKFLLLGLIIFIMNTVFVFKFLNLAASGENTGHYIMVFTFVNLPLYIISIILLIVPFLYYRYYKKMSYSFDKNVLTIDKNMNQEQFRSNEIDGIYINSMGQSSNTVVIRFKEIAKLYQLEGISESSVMKLLNWSETYDVNVERN